MSAASSAESSAESAQQSAAAVASSIRFVTQSVTAEEVASVVAVLSAAGGGAKAPQRRSDWAGRARVGWRSSGLPNARFVMSLPR